MNAQFSPTDRFLKSSPAMSSLLPGPPMGTASLPKHFRASSEAPPVLEGASYDELYINKRFDAQYQDGVLQHHLNTLRNPRAGTGPVFNADLVPPAELRDIDAEKKLAFRKSILNRFPALKELVHPDFTKNVNTHAPSLLGQKSMSATALENLLKTTTTPAAVAAAAEDRPPEILRAFSHTPVSVQKVRVAKVGMANTSPVQSPKPFRLVNKMEARDALKDKPLEVPYDNPYTERPTFGRDPYHGKPFLPVNKSESKAKLENCTYINGPFHPDLGSDTTPMMLHLQEHLANIRYSNAAPPYVFPADMPVFHPNRSTFQATIAQKTMQSPEALNATSSSVSELNPSASTKSLLSPSASATSLLSKDFPVKSKKEEFMYGQTKGSWQRPYFVPAVGEPAHPNSMEATGVKRPSRKTLTGSASTASLAGNADFNMFVPTLSQSASHPRLSKSASAASTVASSSSTKSLIPDPDAAAPVTLGSVTDITPWPKSQAPQLYNPLKVTGALQLPAEAPEPKPFHPYIAPPAVKAAKECNMADHPYHHHHRTQKPHKLYPVSTMHHSESVKLLSSSYGHDTAPAVSTGPLARQEARVAAKKAAEFARTHPESAPAEPSPALAAAPRERARAPPNPHPNISADAKRVMAAIGAQLELTAEAKQRERNESLQRLLSGSSASEVEFEQTALLFAESAFGPRGACIPKAGESVRELCDQLNSNRGFSTASLVVGKLLEQCRSDPRRRAELAYEFFGLTAPALSSVDPILVAGGGVNSASLVAAAAVGNAAGDSINSSSGRRRDACFLEVQKIDLSALVNTARVGMDQPKSVPMQLLLCQLWTQLSAEPIGRSAIAYACQAPVAVLAVADLTAEEASKAHPMALARIACNAHAKASPELLRQTLAFFANMSVHLEIEHPVIETKPAAARPASAQHSKSALACGSFPASMHSPSATSAVELRRQQSAVRVFLQAEIAFILQLLDEASEVLILEHARLCRNRQAAESGEEVKPSDGSMVVASPAVAMALLDMCVPGLEREEPEDEFSRDEAVAKGHATPMPPTLMRRAVRVELPMTRSTANSAAKAEPIDAGKYQSVRPTCSSHVSLFAALQGLAKGQADPNAAALPAGLVPTEDREIVNLASSCVSFASEALANICSGAYGVRRSLPSAQLGSNAYVDEDGVSSNHSVVVEASVQHEQADVRRAVLLHNGLRTLTKSFASMQWQMPVADALLSTFLGLYLTCDPPCVTILASAPNQVSPALNRSMAFSSLSNVSDDSAAESLSFVSPGAARASTGEMARWTPADGVGYAGELEDALVDIRMALQEPCVLRALDVVLQSQLASSNASSSDADFLLLPEVPSASICFGVDKDVSHLGSKLQVHAPAALASAVELQTRALSTHMQRLVLRVYVHFLSTPDLNGSDTFASALGANIQLAAASVLRFASNCRDIALAADAAAALASCIAVIGYDLVEVSEEVEEYDPPLPPKANNVASPVKSPVLARKKTKAADAASASIDDDELRALLASTTALAANVASDLAASSVVSPTNALLQQAAAVTAAESMLKEHHEAKVAEEQRLAEVAAWERRQAALLRPRRVRQVERTVARASTCVAYSVSQRARLSFQAESITADLLAGLKAFAPNAETNKLNPLSLAHAISTTRYLIHAVHMAPHLASHTPLSLDSVAMLVSSLRNFTTVDASLQYLVPGAQTTQNLQFNLHASTLEFRMLLLRAIESVAERARAPQSFAVGEIEVEKPAEPVSEETDSTAAPAAVVASKSTGSSTSQAALYNAFKSALSAGWLFEPIITTLASSSESGDCAFAVVAPLQAAALRALISLLRSCNEWTISNSITASTSAELKSALIRAVKRYIALFHASATLVEATSVSAPKEEVKSPVAAKGKADDKNAKKVPEKAAPAKAPAKAAPEKKPAAAAPVVAAPPALDTNQETEFQDTILSDEQRTWLHLLYLSLRAIESLGRAGSQSDWLTTDVLTVLVTCAGAYRRQEVPSEIKSLRTPAATKASRRIAGSLRLHSVPMCNDEKSPAELHWPDVQVAAACALEAVVTDCGRAPSPRSSGVARRAMNNKEIRRWLSTTSVEFLVRAGVNMGPVDGPTSLLMLVQSPEERTRLETLHASVQSGLKA